MCFPGRLIQCLLVSALVVLISVCGPSSGVKEITETRTVAAPPALPDRPVTSAERFGFEVASMTVPSREGEAQSFYGWETPDGWDERPPTALRAANFVTGGNPEAECYVTVLPGTGGGVEANINRWQRQMNQSPLSSEEIQDLPHITVLGQPSPMVAITGDFTGMTGAARPGFMMLAVVCTLPNHSLFIKMTGPEPQVRAEKDNFIAFCESLRQHPPAP